MISCRWGVCLMVVLCLAGIGSASERERLEKEVFGVLEKVKSRDAAEREAGVREILAVREAVSDALKTMVRDGNAEGASEAAEAIKAGALLLMGEMGLLQCREVLEAEKDWVCTSRWGGGARIMTRSSMLEVGRREPGKWGLERAGFADNVVFKAGPAPANLSEYPALNEALTSLRGNREGGFRGGWNRINLWNRALRDGLELVVWKQRPQLYSDEVRMTAAYVLGEIRSRTTGALRDAIGLKDENDICAGYPATLDVQVSDSAYPCAVALAKSFRPENMKGFANSLGRKGTKQEERELLARVMMAIDAEAAKAAYQARFGSVSEILK